ncbi:MAG: alpha-glucan family phosphorylase [Steroidobacteraceae bacterium]
MFDTDFTQQSRIAYFSMEIALQPDMPTYSGGLGMLAGDTLRSAADLGIQLVAVTLVSRAGYFRQHLDADGLQRESPDTWEPHRFTKLLDANVSIQIGGRPVWVAAWLYVQTGPRGRALPVLLLDTDLPQNHAEDRQITHSLYGGDDRYRLKQEVVLGIGGARLLRALGFHVSQYHLNEGHSALLTLELLRRTARSSEDMRTGDSIFDLFAVRRLCNFTTHTPVEAGHDRFSYALVAEVLGDFIDMPTLKSLAGETELNMTRLALNMSHYINGVAEKHAETSRLLFPGYPVHAITNGVHGPTWTAAPMATLYDRHLPRWRHEPEILVRAECCIPDAAILAAHLSAKETLIAFVRERMGVTLRPDLPILAFARRMTAYKRPLLLLSDIERLRKISRTTPFQLLLAGKAHPHDEQGKASIVELHARLKQLAPDVPSAFIPNYDMTVAQHLVAGVDLWVNTPAPPMEASGTSGMKAAFNGVPSFSVLDGWWLEGHIEGVTGWAIGDGRDGGDAEDIRDLYDKLEHRILPMYFKERSKWIGVMKGAISKTASLFSTHRMLRRYATDAYLN